MKPHKHAELIKAWADGAEIEYRWAYDMSSCPVWSKWIEFDGKTNTFVESDAFEYRIKPEPKPDMYLYLVNCYEDVWKTFPSKQQIDDLQIKLVIDGETGELKSAEVLK